MEATEPNGLGAILSHGPAWRQRGNGRRIGARGGAPERKVVRPRTA